MFRRGSPPLVATVVATGGAGDGNVVVIIVVACAGQRVGAQRVLVDGLVEVQVGGRKAAFVRGEGV